MAPSDSIKEQKLLSPCVSICQMDPEDKFCLGCLRTRSEIALWSSMGQEDQMVLLEDLGNRRAQATGVRRRPSRRNLKRLTM
ncbi:DUF1289 domain-containing protein [Candidatus Puniceispirillum sp.]|nr:DUF1289 domain-containing protein [Candidatus Puniceispirillum sp.]